MQGSAWRAPAPSRWSSPAAYSAAHNVGHRAATVQRTVAFIWFSHRLSVIATVACR